MEQNMKIAICDDEKIWQNKLIKCLDIYSAERNTEISRTCFDNGNMLAESIEKYDIIFLDFQMDKLNGIETAKRIRKTNTDSVIIFVSAFPQVAVDAYEVKAYRFLTKPINKTKLFKALDDYRAEIDIDNFLVFKTHERTLRIRISDILYVEASKNHSIIHTSKEDFEILINLKEIQKKLPAEKFYRCHKAYIVSFLHIKSHNNTDVFFEDGSIAYISRNYLPKFRLAFQEYILKYNTGEFS